MSSRKKPQSKQISDEVALCHRQWDRAATRCHTATNDFTREQARIFLRLRELGLSRADIAREIGCTEYHVRTVLDVHVSTVLDVALARQGHKDGSA